MSETGRDGTAAYDTVVVFSGTLAVAIGAVYYVLRVGFDNPAGPVVRSIALSLFLAGFPWIVHRILERKRIGDTRKWSSSYSLLWLGALAIAAFLGWVVRFGVPNALPILGFAGFLAFGWALVRLSTTGALRTLAFVAGTALFGVWASGVVWGRIYKNPLFFENLILDGRVHHDTLALAALGNMLRTYGVASPGLDGLSYMPYHWGSAWLFAQFSNLTDAHVLDFYQLGFPVTILPLFYGGLIAFAVQMRSRRNDISGTGAELRDDWRHWFVFLAITIGFIPWAAMEGMGIWTSNPLISESYTVAVPCALLFLAALVRWWDNNSASAASRVVVPVLLVPAGTAVLGYLKISVLVLGVCVALNVFLRVTLYRQRVMVAGTVLMILAALFTYGQVSLPAHREGIAPLDFMRSFVRPAWWVFFPVIHLFWTWLYVAGRFWQERITTLADLRAAFRERRLFDVEVLLVVALLGLGPGLVVHIDGGSAFYFSDIQRWLAGGLLLSRIPEFAALVRDAVMRRSESAGTGWRAIPAGALLVAFLLFPVAGSIVSNSLIWPMRMLYGNLETRRGLYPRELAAAIPPRLRSFPALSDEGVLRRGLIAGRNYAVATGLRTIGEMPHAERRRLALFIPQADSVYWHALTRPGACTFQSFVAPAVAAVMMLDGMPPYGCRLSRYYGLQSFRPRMIPQTAEASTGSVLCRRARAWNAEGVLILNFPPGYPMQRADLWCAREGA